MDRELVKPECGIDAPESIRKQRFYVTTGINYTNGPPHAGHAYEEVTSDVISRYHRTFGRDVFYLTGADCHGQKVEQAAIKAGVTPLEIANKYADGFKEINKKLNIVNDGYIMTTEEHHKDLARKLWVKIRDQGDIYLKDYVGWYNIYEEQYVTDQEAEANGFKDEHGRPYEKKTEESYFFRMSKYKEPLVKHILANPSFIQPESRRNEILSFLENDLLDLCISRTVCQWGITCPHDPEYEGTKSHVMYVWFDALINYLSGIHYLDPEVTDLQRFWPCSVHVIGKDIVRFHTVYWPTMLLAAGVPLPECIFGHGFVVAEDGVKMSKSLGNVIDPADMVRLYGADALRFYIARSCTYGSDLAFSERVLCSTFNVVFKDGLGNLVHRATSLCKSYSNGLIPSEAPYFFEGKTPFDVELLKAVFECAFAVTPSAVQIHNSAIKSNVTISQLQRSGVGLQMQIAAEQVSAAISDLNKYLQDAAPWALKGTDPEILAKKNGIVRTVLEGVYILLHFLEPFTPELVEVAFHKLGVSHSVIYNLRSTFDNMPVGTQTYVGDVLCRELVPGEGVVASRSVSDVAKAKEQSKLQMEKSMAEKKAKREQAANKNNQGATDDQPLFTKIELRVGRIVKAWVHETAEKLFCEEVDIGEDKPRLIASGLRQFYNVEDLQNRLVVVVSNLKPRKLAGFDSNGMVLCATTDDKVEFVDPPVGSVVGERLGLEGTDPNAFPAAAPNAVAKKKIFEAFAPGLICNDQGVATFEGTPVVSSKGPCTSPTLRGVPIR